ncbi:hypothetical protein BX600DRAFT_90317 [Xylariales sp. PMI_506]|nr:hypothetical protein BX600DRAFT_90317 [Xylariales sp. PMI_506]
MFQTVAWNVAIRNFFVVIKRFCSDQHPFPVLVEGPSCCNEEDSGAVGAESNKNTVKTRRERERNESLEVKGFKQISTSATSDPLAAATRRTETRSQGSGVFVPSLFFPARQCPNQQFVCVLVRREGAALGCSLPARPCPLDHPRQRACGRCAGKPPLMLVEPIPVLYQSGCGLIRPGSQHLVPSFHQYCWMTLEGGSSAAKSRNRTPHDYRLDATRCARQL